MHLFRLPVFSLAAVDAQALNDVRSYQIGHFWRRKGDGGIQVLLTMGLILGSPCYLVAQTSGQAIPEKWVHGDHLVVPELNFSIKSPHADSKWSYQELPKVQGSNATGFSVDVSADTKYMLVVWENGGSIDSGSSKSFVDGMQKSLPQGWHVGDVHFESSTIPMGGSSKFKVTVNLPNETIIYAYGYAVPGRRSFFFFHYSPETTEPLEFTHFVSSFAILIPSANNSITSTADQGTPLLFILALVGAVVDWRYKRRGGRKPTVRDRLYALLAALLCAGLVTALGIIRGASPGALGSITGLLTVLLFAVWEVGRWNVRRNHPLPPTLPRHVG